MEIHEISSETDSDDCPIYSGIGERFIKKMRMIEAKMKEYEKEIASEDFETHDSLDLSTLPEQSNADNNPSTSRPTKSRIPSVNVSLDSEDDLPLSESILENQSVRRRGRKKKSSLSQSFKKSRKNPKRKAKQSRQHVETEGAVRILGTIAFDDDTGYETTNLPPIDFNSRLKKRMSTLSKTNISISSLDSEQGERTENEGATETTVTIEWKGKEKMERKVFELRRYQKFETVFEELAEMENIPTSKVILMHNFNSVSPSDTPSSRNFTYYAALTGYISQNDMDYGKFVGVLDEKTKDGEVLIVKLLLEDRMFSVSIRKNQKMSVLYEKCCEELKCPENNLKMTYDGENVDPDECVTDLDLEGGEIFHVYLKNDAV